MTFPSGVGVSQGSSGTNVPAFVNEKGVINKNKILCEYILMTFIFIIFLLLFGFMALDSIFLYLTTLLVGIVLFSVLYSINYYILSKNGIVFDSMKIFWVSIIITAISYIVRKKNRVV